MPGSGSGPTEGVHLLGPHDLELAAVCSVQVTPLASVVVGLHVGRRTVPLTVEAGHRYSVDYNPMADFYTVRPIAIGQPLPTPRELASDDPGLDRCLLAPTELDRSRCEAWLQE